MGKVFDIFVVTKAFCQDKFYLIRHPENAPRPSLSWLFFGVCHGSGFLLTRDSCNEFLETKLQISWKTMLKCPSQRNIGAAKSILVLSVGSPVKQCRFSTQRPVSGSSSNCQIWKLWQRLVVDGAIGDLLNGQQHHKSTQASNQPALDMG